MKEKVAILGASDRPDRYAHMAFRMLREHGHEVIPVSPKLKEVEGVQTVASVSDIAGGVDTLTMYVGRAISSELQAEILALKPRRVIFNPGSENSELAAALAEAGSEVVQGCTLVMLRAGEY